MHESWNVFAGKINNKWSLGRYVVRIMMVVFVRTYKKMEVSVCLGGMDGWV